MIFVQFAILMVMMMIMMMDMLMIRDATFQEISWNQEIWDRKKEFQEKWNSVSRKKRIDQKGGKGLEKKEENVSKFPY